MEEEKGIKDNVEEVKENLQAGPSLTAGAEPREEGSMVLRTEDLVKKYGKRTVVSHVSIDVKQGEIVGLLGPNGAGKTTSFYMTVGLITPNEGRIFLNDLDITKYPVYKRAQTGIRLFGAGGFRVPSNECGRQYCICTGNDRQAFGVSERQAGEPDCRVPFAEGKEEQG